MNPLSAFVRWIGVGYRGPIIGSLFVLVPLAWFVVLQFQYHGKVARWSDTLADMGRLRDALESYYKAHGRYPAARPMIEVTRNRRRFLRQGGGPGLTTYEFGGRAEMPIGLTTPVAHLTWELRDKFTDSWFAYSEGAAPYAYATRPGKDGSPDEWVIWSAGADRDYDIKDSDAAFDAWDRKLKIRGWDGDGDLVWMRKAGAHENGMPISEGN